MSRKNLPLLLLFFGTLFLIAPLYAQDAEPPEDDEDEVQVPVLFDADDPLELTVLTDMRTLLRDRGDDPEYHPATLTYHAEGAPPLTLAIEVRTRGNFRNNPRNCDFPPLRLNFKKKQVAGTVFAAQDKLKLVTHCNEGGHFEDNVIQEYLIYKTYNLLTDMSFRVRLVHMTYEDSEGKRKPVEQYGFLIEDAEAMAARNNGVLLDIANVHQERTDREHATLMSVFEYLIANTDWSVPAQHNMELISVSQAERPFPVPYDFDFSGLVDARYATPAPQLGIQSVTDRLYRGFCRSQEELAPVFALFNEKKDAIYALYNDTPYLSDRAKRDLGHFLDDFYESFENDRAIQWAYMETCRTLGSG